MSNFSIGICAMLLSGYGIATASPEKILYRLDGGPDVSSPSSPLIAENGAET